MLQFSAFLLKMLALTVIPERAPDVELRAITRTGRGIALPRPSAEGAARIPSIPYRILGRSLRAVNPP